MNEMAMRLITHGWVELCPGRNYWHFAKRSTHGMWMCRVYEGSWMFARDY